MESREWPVEVRGDVIDDDTRCVHYHAREDVIAIRFYCCKEFFPCFRCHSEATDHAREVWPRQEFAAPAILCGVCRTTMSISEYQGTDGCPACGAAFNPGCALHYSLYFEE